MSNPSAKDVGIRPTRGIINIQTMTHIYDSNQKTIFEFPVGTLLDNILPDLWIVILRYNSNLFIIGKHDGTYDGYRKTTEKDFSQRQFSKYYANH